RVALDESDVREVEPTHLVDARNDLVDPVLCDELALAPQTRMHRVGCIATQEVEAVTVPGDVAVGILDHTRRNRAEKASIRVGEVRAFVVVIKYEQTFRSSAVTGEN